MLLANDPGEEMDFPVFGALLYWPDSRKLVDGIIITPVCGRGGGGHTYVFTFGGAAWTYHVGKRRTLLIEPYRLQERGAFPLLSISLQDFEPVAGFMRARAKLKGSR